MRATLTIYIAAELKDLLQARAAQEKVPVNELVAERLARWLKRPDLAEIPRRTRVGRPRKWLPRVPVSPPA